MKSKKAKNSYNTIMMHPLKLEFNTNLLDNVIKPLVPEHHLRREKHNDPVLE